MRFWGWGALRVGTAPKGWTCPVCGQRARTKTGTGQHHYPFSVVCTACAKAAFLAELLSRFG